LPFNNAAAKQTGGAALTHRDVLVGVGVLLISVLLYFFRRVVKDRQSIMLREDALPPA